LFPKSKREKVIGKDFQCDFNKRTIQKKTTTKVLSHPRVRREIIVKLKIIGVQATQNNPRVKNARQPAKRNIFHKFTSETQNKTKQTHKNRNNM